MSLSNSLSASFLITSLPLCSLSASRSTYNRQSTRIPIRAWMVSCACAKRRDDIDYECIIAVLLFVLVLTLQTVSVEGTCRSYCEASSRSDSHETTRLLWNPSVQIVRHWYLYTGQGYVFVTSAPTGGERSLSLFLIRGEGTQ